MKFFVGQRVKYNSDNEEYEKDNGTRGVVTKLYETNPIETNPNSNWPDFSVAIGVRFEKPLQDIKDIISDWLLPVVIEDTFEKDGEE